MTTTTTAETIKIRTITESTWKEILTAMDAAEAAVPEAHNRVRATRRGETLVAELEKRAVVRELREDEVIGMRYASIRRVNIGSRRWSYLIYEEEVGDVYGASGDRLFYDPRSRIYWRAIENSAIILPDGCAPEDGIIDWLERTGVAPESELAALDEALAAGGDDGVASGDAITLRGEPTRWIWCDDATFPYEDSIDDIVALVPDAGHQGHYALHREVR